MKQSDQNDLVHRLDSTLCAWKVKDPLPPRFCEQVWRRIERSEALGPEGLWHEVKRRLALALTRPSVALSYVTLLVLAGVLAGLLQARVEQTRTQEELSARYVQTLDPYQMHR